MVNLNLLPPAQRSIALRTIKVHFFATVLFFVAVWAIIVLVFVGQGWIFFRINNGALAQELSVEQSTDTAQRTKVFEDAAKKTNALLSRVSTVATQPQDDAAFLIDLVTSLVPQGVHLHSLVINSVSGTVTIGGSADTRDEFLAFQQQLQNQNAYFTNVQSPLSNLLNPDNISFSFLITLARK